MIAWLANTPRNVGLLSLDCDLDSTAIDDDECGTGEDVAAYLASTFPECPVLIHSSNAMRAPSMHMELALAGCKHVKLCSFQDSDSWEKDVRSQIDAESPGIRQSNVQPYQDGEEPTHAGQRQWPVSCETKVSSRRPVMRDVRRVNRGAALY